MSDMDETLTVSVRDVMPCGPAVELVRDLTDPWWSYWWRSWRRAKIVLESNWRAGGQLFLRYRAVPERERKPSAKPSFRHR